MKATEYNAVRMVAEKHYSKKKLEHANTVEMYVEADPRFALLSESDQLMVRAIAVAHDVIEDTKCSWSELTNGIHGDEDRRHFYVAVDLLTHKKPDDTYSEYIDMIVRSKNLFAIMVKQADMKDHIVRKATLSEKLRAKYEPVIPKLLGM